MSGSAEQFRSTPKQRLVHGARTFHTIADNVTFETRTDASEGTVDYHAFLSPPSHVLPQLVKTTGWEAVGPMKTNTLYSVGVIAKMRG